MSFEDLTRAQLLEMLDDFLAQHDRRREELDSRADEQARLIAELKLYQVELEIQNRELRKAHVELEEARDRFGELFELAPLAYLVLDDAGRITGANQSATTLLRQSVDALQGQALVELGGHSDTLATLLARSTQSTPRRAAEVQLTIDGDLRDLEVIVACSWDDDRRSTYRCALIDVTPRRRAERERDRARASEQALHECFQALDRIHLAVNGMLASADRTRVRDLLGLFADAVLQLFDADHVSVTLGALELATSKRHAEYGAVAFTQPIRFAGRQLGELRVAANPASLRGQSAADRGKILELLAERLALAVELARLHDVEAEEHLRLHWLDRARNVLSGGGEPDEVLAAIAACCTSLRGTLAADCAAYALDDDTLIPLLAPRRFGTTLQRWLDRERPRQLCKLDAANTPRLARLLAATSCESVLILPLHSRRHGLGYLCFALPAREAGELTRTLEEISFMAAGALDTAQLMQALRGAVEARDQLLALVAHDLRSPLNAISLTATSLSEPPSHTERRRSAPQFQLIQRSVQRMSHLIEDLLTAANIDSGTFAVDTRVLSANELAFEAAALNAPAAENKDIELRVECPEPSAQIEADRDRMLQVLTNLIVNALKFSTRGHRVVVSVAREGALVRFCVRDQGAGMSREQATQAFRRYWRGKGTRGGLGLGLFIAERIVSAHHGRIWVESAPGAGAAFHFTLPVAGESARVAPMARVAHSS